jgi:hypothetical protein
MKCAALPRELPAPAPPVPPSLTFSPARRGSLAMAALVLNANEKLGPLHRLLQQSGSYFSSYVILLLENDSTDCTAERMRELCALHAADTLCLNYIGLRARLRDLLQPDPNTTRRHGGSPRFAKMSFLRNLLLHHATRMRSYEHLALIDGDLSNGREWLPGRPQLNFLASASDGAFNGVSKRWGGHARGWDAHALLGAITRANQMRGERGWSASLPCAYQTIPRCRRLREWLTQPGMLSHGMRIYPASPTSGDKKKCI